MILEIAVACPRLVRLALHFDPPALQHIESTFRRIGRLESISQGLDSLFHVCRRLEDLSLDCPHSIVAFPGSISNLAGLVRLKIRVGDSVRRLPEEIGALSTLEPFSLEAPRLTSLPSSLGDLSKLRELELR
ncbi:hypothetical protein CLOP_g4346 [Closterium sp. NIES-67]|nr:hypothetical protein CLOP_g4346 [Closterium sp. NIES-67]